MRISPSQVRRIGALALLMLAATASFASAQAARVRVTAEQATIWRAGFVAPATVVRQGTELEAVARRGSWYEVTLPPSGATATTTGFIAVTQVELISGQPPPERPLQTPASPVATRAVPARPPEPAVGVRAFGAFGVEWFNASQTFSAVLDRRAGYLFGGGAEVRMNDLFVQGSIERFKRTGQRVFELDGHAFGLGLADVVTITPLQFTVGYRFHRRSVNPYVGGGIGRVHYTESSDFSDAAENVDMNVTSYHVLVGFAWRAANPWWGTAFELQYTHIPNALTGGVADAFGEHNLGGVEARVKIEVGK